MLNSRLPIHAAQARRAGGFTLVELLVVIGIIAILAGVALGPITNGIKKAKESAAMQTTRSLALAEFQYANDNNSYPDGTDAGLIAQSLVTGGYISDPSIFRISGGSAKAPTTAGTITSTSVDYDFMGCQAATPIGIPTSAPDTLPVVWSPEPGVPPTMPGGNTGSAFKPTTGLFGTDGMAVAYKSNSSYFRTAQSASDTTDTFPGATKLMFIDQFSDMDAPTGDTYTNRKGNEQY